MPEQSEKPQEMDYKLMYERLKAELEFKNSGEKSFKLKPLEVDEIKKLIAEKLSSIESDLSDPNESSRDMDEIEKLIKTEKEKLKVNPLNDAKKIISYEANQRFKILYGIYKTLNHGFDLPEDIIE